MKVFSFCIYGDDIKYYLGLRENVRIIREFYPEFHIFIYVGIYRLQEFLDSLKNEFSQNTHFIDTETDGVLNMVYRYMPILTENAAPIIIRDADSEINERDRWTIDDFLNDTTSRYTVQVIRDHYYHKSRITGGLTMFKRDINKEIKTILRDLFIEYKESKESIKYGSDEKLLNERIWPIIKNDIIVYSNICVFEGEAYRTIHFKNDGTNFCGNVVLYQSVDNKGYQFNYFHYPVIEQLRWLIEQKQYRLAVQIIDEYGFHNIPFSEKSIVIHYVLIALIRINTIESLRDCFIKYSLFSKYDIINEVKSQLPHFFNMVRNLGYSVIGTCDPEYIPKSREFVIYFGNYPDDYMSLPQSFQIYRHFLFFKEIVIDRFYSNKCWESVDRIFIMGLEGEFERMNTTWSQLCLMNAPLDRIEEYRAKKDANLEDIYIGATKNHIDCLEEMKRSGYKNCLFLEDDFIFTSRIRENQLSLTEFFNRKYDYNICFLSASKFHERKSYDDLLIVSKQYCTTSSGYLISKSNLQNVLETVKEGYNLLLEYPDQSHIYCIDRYWSKLDKLYIFKKKLGFQNPSLSKITGELNKELD
jgi:GR25 family glycosyltransferase involved in LPS biosynthesis